MKCIFSIAPVGSLEKSRAPDIGRGGTGHGACASGVLSVPGSIRVRHQTPGTGCGLNPVGASGAACLLWVSLTESTGRSGRVRWFGSGAPERLQCSLGKGPDDSGCVRWCGFGDPEHLQTSLRT